MGGHGSGGHRTGSGQKPREGMRVVGGRTARGSSRGAGASTADTPDPATVPVRPERLSEAEAPIWDRLAPLAFEARTLTVRTVDALVLLCKLTALFDKMQQQLDEQGLTFVKTTVDGSGQEHQELKSHPLVSQQRGTAQRIEALMGRFGLAPYGKPVDDGGKRKRASNPWAVVGGAK